VAGIAARLAELGCATVSLADTIGIGTPVQMQAVVDAVAAVVPRERLTVHVHDTYGQALANILAALERGVAMVESSAGGLGGCPFAPGATGNVATEDILYMLHGMGIRTGVDLEAVVEASWAIAGTLGRPPASRVARALWARRRVEAGA
jgi:isopropylmalate/homocitrate/citramalate synthase